MVVLALSILVFRPIKLLMPLIVVRGITRKVALRRKLHATEEKAQMGLSGVRNVALFCRFLRVSAHVPFLFVACSVPTAKYGPQYGWTFKCPDRQLSPNFKVLFPIVLISTSWPASI